MLYIRIIILIAFIFNSVGITSVKAQDLLLPKPGVMVRLSPPINPAVLKAIKVHADNPFRFDFVLDKGDSNQSQTELKEESSKLIKYFLASLTIPEKDLWVNLSPYEKDRIVPESFGVTQMGRDLLAEDYMLKEISASLIYPEDEVGKKFWKRVYEEAQKKYGNTNVPVNTFNKVWIVPEKAVVYENAKAGTACVVESKLKVMLEADYLSLDKHNEGAINESPVPNKDVNQLGSQIVREIVIPELTKEVNEGKNFAQLRQVYNSLILATWYKKKIKDSILSEVYADRSKTQGVNIDDPNEKEKIYQQYLTAFKKGVYNYIKEETDPITNQTTPRKYFSGGLSMAMSTPIRDNFGHLGKAAFDVLEQEPPGISNIPGALEVNVNIASSAIALAETGVVSQVMNAAYNKEQLARVKDTPMDIFFEKSGFGSKYSSEEKLFLRSSQPRLAFVLLLDTFSPRPMILSQLEFLRIQPKELRAVEAMLNNPLYKKIYADMIEFSKEAYSDHANALNARIFLWKMGEISFGQLYEGWTNREYFSKYLPLHSLIPQGTTPILDVASGPKGAYFMQQYRNDHVILTDRSYLIEAYLNTAKRFFKLGDNIVIRRADLRKPQEFFLEKEYRFIRLCNIDAFVDDIPDSFYEVLFNKIADGGGFSYEYGDDYSKLEHPIRDRLDVLTNSSLWRTRKGATAGIVNEKVNYLLATKQTKRASLMSQSETGISSQAMKSALDRIAGLPREMAERILRASYQKHVYDRHSEKTEADGLLLSYVSRYPEILREVSDRILKMVKSSDRVLSIGEGQGQLAQRLQRNGLDVTAVDNNQNNTSEALKRNVHQLTGDATNLLSIDPSFTSGSFDVVIFNESIGGMDINNAFREAYRVLKPGGKIIVTAYPAEEIPNREHLSEQTDYLYYSLDEIQKALFRSGFDKDQLKRVDISTSLIPDFNAGLNFNTALHFISIVKPPVVLESQAMSVSQTDKELSTLLKKLPANWVHNLQILSKAFRLAGSFQSEEDSSAAILLDHLSLPSNSNVLTVGPSNKIKHIVYASLKGAKVDIVQPEEYDFPLFAGTAIRKEQHLDFLNKAIDEVRRKEQAAVLNVGRIFPVSIQKSGIKNSRYDYVVLLNVLNGIPDNEIPQVLKEVMRVVKNGGFIISGNSEKERKWLASTDCVEGEKYRTTVAWRVVKKESYAMTSVYDNPSILRAMKQKLKAILARIKDGTMPQMILIGDKHGSVKDVKEALIAVKAFVDAAANRSKQIEVIFHGDAFDRGKQNVEMFDLMKELKAMDNGKANSQVKVHFLWGNHDIMLVKSVLFDDAAERKNWVFKGVVEGKNINNGGQDTLIEFAKEGRDIKELAEFMLKNFEVYHEDAWGMLHIHAPYPIDLQGHPIISRDKLDHLQGEFERYRSGELSKSEIRETLYDPDLNLLTTERNGVGLFIQPYVGIKKGKNADEQREIDLKVKELTGILIDIEKKRMAGRMDSMPGVILSDDDYRKFVEDHLREVMNKNPNLKREYDQYFDILDKNEFLYSIGSSMGLFFGHINELVNIDHTFFGIDDGGRDSGYFDLNLTHGLQFKPSDRDQGVRDSILSLRDIQVKVESLLEKIDEKLGQIEGSSPKSAAMNAEVRSVLEGFNIHFNPEGKVDLSKVEQNVSWVMDKRRGVEYGPIVKDMNNVVEAKLLHIQGRVLQELLKNEFPILSKGEMGHGRSTVLLGVGDVGGVVQPIAIKLLGSEYEGEGKDYLKRDEIIAAQVLDRLGSHPRFYGIIKDDNGKIIGYALQLVIGEMTDESGFSVLEMFRHNEYPLYENFQKRLGSSKDFIWGDSMITREDENKNRDVVFIDAGILDYIRDVSFIEAESDDWSHIQGHSFDKNKAMKSKEEKNAAMKGVDNEIKKLIIRTYNQQRGLPVPDEDHQEEIPVRDGTLNDVLFWGGSAYRITKSRKQNMAEIAIFKEMGEEYLSAEYLDHGIVKLEDGQTFPVLRIEQKPGYDLWHMIETREGTDGRLTKEDALEVCDLLDLLIYYSWFIEDFKAQNVVVSHSIAYAVDVERSKKLDWMGGPAAMAKKYFNYMFHDSLPYLDVLWEDIDKDEIIKNHLRDLMLRLHSVQSEEDFKRDMLVKIKERKREHELVVKARENAAMAKDKTGGVDLTSNKFLQTQNAGEGIKFHMDPAMLQQLQNAPGFYPVIINMQPMTDLRKFLGLNELPAKGQLAQV